MTDFSKQNKSDWTKVAFGDVVENINDFFDRNEKSEYRFLAGKHLDEGNINVTRWGSTTRDLFPPTFKRKFCDGDVLFHSRNIKKVAVPDFNGITGEKLFVLRTKDGAKLQQEMISYLLLSDDFKEFATTRLTGSVNKILNWTSLISYEFMLPPLQEQARIIDTLKNIEKTLSAFQQLLAACKNLYLASAAELFQSSSTVESSDNHDQVTSPASWNNHSLGELFSFQLGKMSSKKARAGNEQFPYIKNENVLWGTFDLANLPLMNFSADERLKYNLEVGDLLICEGGEVGRCAIWQGSSTKIFYQKAIHRLRPKSDNVSNYFMEHYVKFCSRTGTFDRLATGGTIKHLSQDSLKKLVLPFPDIDEQHRIATYLTQLEKHGLSIKTRLTNLKNVQQKLVNQVIN